MEPAEIAIHSFIVKVWFDDTGDRPRWRGHVTHVPTGERRYLTTLSALTAFMVPYLVEMGINSQSIE